MLKNLRNIVYDKTSKLTLYENKIDINNYEEVILFDEEQILLMINNKLLKIKGKDLIITRLENNELLVEGKIKIIDLGD